MSGRNCFSRLGFHLKSNTKTERKFLQLHATEILLTNYKSRPLNTQKLPSKIISGKLDLKLDSMIGIQIAVIEWYAFLSGLIEVWNGITF